MCHLQAARASTSSIPLMSAGVDDAETRQEIDVGDFVREELTCLNVYAEMMGLGKS